MLTTYRNTNIRRPLIERHFPDEFATAACEYGATLIGSAWIDSIPYALVRQTRKPVKGWNRAPLIHLVGVDDGQVFAHRVPSTAYNVREALSWMTPGAVARARLRGWPVQRQGDIWAAGKPTEQLHATVKNVAILEGIRHSIIEGASPWITLRHDGAEHPDVTLYGGHQWALYRTPSVDGIGD